MGELLISDYSAQGVKVWLDSMVQLAPPLLADDAITPSGPQLHNFSPLAGIEEELCILNEEIQIFHHILKF